ncbi:MAG: hypothetical protein A2W05_07155 [Candidatus Schekmanbacteria bacterium RBG_16_38_10]|uniref:Nuclease associated modular domain-containing protein n=1 Tax=Candidatus Schekmanbacteria bacterium RBG_16_38_10 TaxID=1817879 RepID=A0A1F7RZQ3_9BACT|nr:MAG: hypothetical protein A2W05_07155 [Candidatus Schekmanbacteria bacterium RBG_16_38_10]
MKYLFQKGNKINQGRKQTLKERKKRSIVAKEKGFGKWMNGRKLSEKHRKNISIGNMGRIFTEETKNKIRKSNTGKKHTEESKNKNREAHIGKKHSIKTKQLLRKISLKNARRGENHPDWKGGISKIRYPREFNNELKLKIRTRDNFTCCLCGQTEREELEELNRVLCINHIDFDKNNCKENNLNTLCLRCNVKINREREYWSDYFINK